MERLTQLITQAILENKSGPRGPHWRIHFEGMGSFLQVWYYAQGMILSPNPLVLNVQLKDERIQEAIAFFEQHLKTGNS